MWYYDVNFNELNGVSPFMAKDGLYMDEVNFKAAGLDPVGREVIFVHELAHNFFLTEEEVFRVIYSVDCFDCAADVNILTPREIKEILSEVEEGHNPYYRAEIHGY